MPVALKIMGLIHSQQIFLVCFKMFVLNLDISCVYSIEKEDYVFRVRDLPRSRENIQSEDLPMLPVGQDHFHSNEVPEEIVDEPGRPIDLKPGHDQEHGHVHDHGNGHEQGHDHGHGHNHGSSSDQNAEEPANFNANSMSDSEDCDKGDIKDKYTFVALIDIMFVDGCKRTCTGAIIHDNVVITAAHCFTMLRDPFSQPELSLSFVVIGTKRMFETGYEQYLPIERVVTHPRFRGWTADLALVFTFANMDSDKPGRVLPLYLEKSSVPVDSNVTVFSWGKCNSDINSKEKEDPENEIKYLNKISKHSYKQKNIHHDSHYKKPEHHKADDVHDKHNDHGGHGNGDHQGHGGHDKGGHYDESGHGDGGHDKGSHHDESGHGGGGHDKGGHHDESGHGDGGHDKGSHHDGSGHGGGGHDKGGHHDESGHGGGGGHHDGHDGGGHSGEGGDIGPDDGVPEIIDPNEVQNAVTAIIDGNGVLSKPLSKSGTNSAKNKKKNPRQEIKNAEYEKQDQEKFKSRGLKKNTIKHNRIYHRHGKKKPNFAGQYNAPSKVVSSTISTVKPSSKPSRLKNQDQFFNWQTSKRSYVTPSGRSIYIKEKDRKKQTYHQNIDNDRLSQRFTKLPKWQISQPPYQLYPDNNPQYQKNSNNQPPSRQGRTNKQQQRINYNQQPQRINYDRAGMISSLSAENRHSLEEHNIGNQFSKQRSKWVTTSDPDRDPRLHMRVLKLNKVQANRPNLKLDVDRNTRRGHAEVEPAVQSFFDLQDYDGQNFFSLKSNTTGQEMGDEPFLEMIKKGIKKTNQTSNHSYNKRIDNRRYIRQNKLGNLNAENSYKKSGNVRYIRNNTHRHKVRRQMPRVHHTHNFEYYNNWRRTIGQQHNNLSVGMFGYVNIASCKKTIERSLPPMYEIDNKHEYLCYTSEEFYITNEDSGAPVVQKDELVAVTIGGIDSDGDHVAVGMKIACFCNWIAYHLPNHDGAKLHCCHGCCVDHTKTHYNHDIQNDQYDGHHSRHNMLRSGQKMLEKENQYYPILNENQSPSKIYEPQDAMYRLASSDDGKQIESQREIEGKRKQFVKSGYNPEIA